MSVSRFADFRAAGLFVPSDAEERTQAIKDALTVVAQEFQPQLDELHQNKPKQKRRSPKENRLEAEKMVQTMLRLYPFIQEFADEHTHERQTCTLCKRSHPLTYYICAYPKNPMNTNQLKKQCQICRNVAHRTRTSKNSKRGLWNWFHHNKVKPILKRECMFCGDKNCSLQMDHYPTKKKHHLADPVYWSRFKTVQPYVEEIRALRSFLCNACHMRISSHNKELGRKRKPVSNDQRVNKQRHWNNTYKAMNRPKIVLLKTGCLPADEKQRVEACLTGKLGECNKCGKKCTKKNAKSFHFNHLNGSKKRKKFSDNILCRTVLWKTVLKLLIDEIKHAGAELLCSECHAEHTAKERQKKRKRLLY